MATATFLSNDSLWREIQDRVARAKEVRAAVAYMGQGGAELLPLRRGHRLVVDMSLAAVRQGVTDPKEVLKLIRRGVRVFSRGTLHAKFLIADRVLIAGSANVSRNSRSILDEAGVLTGDSAAVRRAVEFFDRLCTEPVRPEYLKTCLAAYRRPKFKAAVEGAPARHRRVVEAKLWFIGGIRLLETTPPGVEEAVQRAERALKRPGPLGNRLDSLPAPVQVSRSNQRR